MLAAMPALVAPVMWWFRAVMRLIVVAHSSERYVCFAWEGRGWTSEASGLDKGIARIRRMQAANPEVDR
jgi:hypothetical protein